MSGTDLLKRRRDATGDSEAKKKEGKGIIFAAHDVEPPEGSNGRQTQAKHKLKQPKQQKQEGVVEWSDRRKEFGVIANGDSPATLNLSAILSVDPPQEGGRFPHREV
eukprot:gene13231-6209_t